MKKRGDITTGTVVTLILLVLAAIVLFAVINVFNSGMAGSVQDVVCAFSVRLSTKSQIIASSFSVFPMACYEKKIELVEGTKDEVMKQIADLMATCWWMYGEGKFEGVKGRILHAGSDPIYNCYAVDNLKIKDKEKITYDDFYKFLIGKNWDRGKGVDSYYNYFEKASEKFNICLDDSYTDDVIFESNGKPVYVKFYDDDDDTGELFPTVIGGIVGFFVPVPGGPIAVGVLGTFLGGPIVNLFGGNVDMIILSHNSKVQKNNNCFPFVQK